MNTFQQFNELSLPAGLLKSLAYMQFTTPTEVQAASIPHALKGMDILGTAQTGTGKTAAFGIPLVSALISDPNQQALILAPTRELAAQIFAVMEQLSQGSRLYGALVVGGESFGRQRSELDRGVHYIVATPGRLNDHLESRTVNLENTTMLVLDEVDRMLDMGFAPQIKQIMRYVPKDRQTLLFSATLPPDVRNLANSFLNNPIRVDVGQATQPKADITEETVETTQAGKNALILEELEKREGKIIIFARTQSRSERLAGMLYDQGHPVVCLHGGRTQGQRKLALERFRKGSHRIMVATDIAGRGIDVLDIEHVINFDAPATREDYIHRIGRTGRIGKTGRALNLLVAGDADGEEVFSGVKPKARTVFRSRRSYGRRR